MTSESSIDYTAPPGNRELAEKLQSVSDLLRAQGADPFRAQAYQRAAETIGSLDRPAWQIYEADGIDGLDALPGIGRTISRALQQLIRGGRWTLLERLTGNHAVEETFGSVPGIGPRLAQRLHDELGIETLVELQAAAWDGRLRKMPGFGEKRIRGVRESLAARGRTPDSAESIQSQPFPGQEDLTSEVPVAELLDIDQQYRNEASRGQLPRIAPRRLNPTVRRWLPILHTRRGGRDYTAMFSNTPRAHAMGTTDDWVVIYLEDHQHRGQHGRWTVITSRFGGLKGRRIVRGRERECQAFYQSSSS